MYRTRLLTVMSLVVLVALLGASAVLGNGQAKPGAAAGGYAAAPGGRVSAAGPPVSTGRFTLEFVDAELVDVFQALATQSGVNVAVSGSVKGKTTLRLRNVTLDQAMGIITRLNGLDYAWVEAAYVVGTPEEVRTMRVSELRTQAVVLQHARPEHAQEVLSKLTPDITVSTQKGSRTILLLGTEASLAKAQRALAQMDVPPLPEPPTTEVVSVRYLKAEEVAEMISTSLPEVKVQLGPRPNSLAITADSLQWESVRSLLASVDTPPPAAQAVQAIYHVKYMNAAELQTAVTALLPDARVMVAPRSFAPTVRPVSTGAGQSAALLGVGGGQAADRAGPPVTSLIVSGAPWTVERALEILEGLDTAPRQIHIAAVVTEVSREDITRLGINWAGLGTAGTSIWVGEPVAGTGTTATAPKFGEDQEFARNLEVGKIQRSHLQWTGTIRALEELGRARILSNPSVRTLDGRETALHTGETLLYEVVIAQGTQGGAITDTREIKVGVTLSVTPQVNQDGEITLAIAPNVSAITGMLGRFPIVSNREVLTTVRVRSGETAVIAGLVTDREQTQVTKVPFLGDIPVLGELFKSRTKSPSNTEILIFVTPTIVED